jgi:hypothetical protein
MSLLQSLVRSVPARIIFFKFPQTTGEFLLRAFIQYQERQERSTQSRRHLKLVKPDKKVTQ